MSRKTFSLFLLVPLVVAPPIKADELDWSSWQRLPVFDQGRLLPLDTFARAAVETICGRESPWLSLEGALVDADGQVQEPATAPALKAARELLPDGKPRRFAAAELLFSWMVEPEKWEDVPFLRAEGQLRELLAGSEQIRQQAHGATQTPAGLPRSGREGETLKYVSPRQLSEAIVLRQRLRDLQRQAQDAQDRGEHLQLSGVDKKAKDLADAYGLFRLLSFNPTRTQGGRGSFEEALVKVAQSWGDLGKSLDEVQKLLGDAAGNKLAEETAAALQKLAVVAQQSDYGLKDVEPPAAALHRAAAALAAHYEATSRRIAEQSGSNNATPEGRIQFAAIVQQTKDFARAAADTHFALYEAGHSLRLVPALNPAALSRNREAEDPAHPWLDVRAMLFGSADLLAGYPTGELAAVREAFERVQAAYVDRQNLPRPERFAAAMADFAAAVRRLGEAIEPARRSLPVADRDDETLAATAYPPPGATDLEVQYNRVNPFFWSWIVSLSAAICFALAVGFLRKPLFWLGIGVLSFAQAAAIYGFALRGIITGWVPVASMFETMAYVGLVAALMGLWFTLLPLVWPGLKRAWAMTGLGRGMSTGRVLLSVLHLALAAGMFYFLTAVPYGRSGGHGYFNILPRMEAGSTIPTFQNLLTWAVGLGVLLPAVWFVPRGLLTLVVALATVPASLDRTGRGRAVQQVLARKPFALAGAIMGFVSAYIGYFSPLWHNDIGSMTVVLRDNFWLTIHVLTITESYAAGVLALGLGNIALAYYLFGRYRDVAIDDPLLAGHRPAGGYQAPATAIHRRPPEACSALGGYIYWAMQVAVVLLAAGTIFGALWADVSWGRFWGWDAKEVSALWSLLVYLAILHGRYAGWLGNFSLAVGSVAGATAITGAWYGVNFVFKSGLHSYATGAGQWEWVALGLGLEWLFAALAGSRYWWETRHTASPPPLASAVG